MTGRCGCSRNKDRSTGLTALSQVPSLAHRISPGRGLRSAEVCAARASRRRRWCHAPAGSASLHYGGGTQWVRAGVVESEDNATAVVALAPQEPRVDPTPHLTRSVLSASFLTPDGARRSLSPPMPFSAFGSRPWENTKLERERCFAHAWSQNTHGHLRRAPDEDFLGLNRLLSSSAPPVGGAARPLFLELP